MDKPLLNIRTLEDLNRVLYMQTVIGRRAKDELTQIRQQVIVNPDDPTEVEELWHREQVLLEKYANNPTLTEFNKLPSLQVGTPWGATFGVTVVVNDLLLETVYSLQKRFRPILSSMLLVLLQEMDNPQHKYLIDPLLDKVKFQLTTESGAELSEPARTNMVRAMLAELVEAFLSVLVTYELVEDKSDETGAEFNLTPLGRRLMLHLMDARRYIDTLAEAHSRFQSEKPRLTLI